MKHFTFVVFLIFTLSLVSCAMAEQETWTCHLDGAINKGNFCHECGKAKADAGKYSVGEYITFGTYPQSSEGTDHTPIEWLILARDGKKALLISRYALDCQPFNTEYTAVTWETCTIRRWLNDTFINNAFTVVEQDAIVTTTIDSSDWSGKILTQDKIYLLSYDEAFHYFGNDDTRMCALTDYAQEKEFMVSFAEAYQFNPDYTAFRDEYTMDRIYQADGKLIGRWWLRWSGLFEEAACVEFDGIINDIVGIYLTNIAVRPALWINLDSGIF